MWHGLADELISWQQNVYYYNKAIDYYQGLDNVSPWFRFFLAPGVTHCGGGVGPQPQNLFDVMVNWKWTKRTSDSILAAGEDDLSCGLAFAPATTAKLTPEAVNGWYRNPTRRFLRRTKTRNSTIPSTCLTQHAGGRLTPAPSR